jgi:hypothetical protein
MAGFLPWLKTSRVKATAGWAVVALASLSMLACQAEGNTGVGGGAPSSPSPTLTTPTPTVRATAPLATPTPEPTQPPVQVTTVTFVNAPLTARRGQASTLIVRTSPNTGCTIEVDYKSGPSQAQGLVPKNSDGAGNVSWTWIVGTRTTSGQWPITVTCGSGSNQTYITVT